jgi:hypothetical protein
METNTSISVYERIGIDGNGFSEREKGVLRQFANTPQIYRSEKKTDLIEQSLNKGVIAPEILRALGLEDSVEFYNDETPAEEYRPFDEEELGAHES